MKKVLNKIIFNMITHMKNVIIEPKVDSEVPAMLTPKGDYTGPQIGHIAYYTRGNAGDVLLSRTVRDSIEMNYNVRWKGYNAHTKVTKDLVEEFNKLDRLIIGGGGLFLVDTNPNNLSGWQWSCDVENLKNIETPIVIFAVGYNKFRNQKEFSSVFSKHLEILANKSIYIALRNNGSIKAVKEYLPTELHGKLRYQPCPTTISQILYPEICERGKKNRSDFIALNCAFDRIDLRLGKEKDRVLNDLALSMREISKSFRIKYYSHSIGDEKMLPYLDRVGVPYDLVKLYDVHPSFVIEEYSKPLLAIGMRGHAQMIPFGCGTPIISLISHDKLRWFLDDINKNEWGIEMLSKNFSRNLTEKIYSTIEQRTQIIGEINIIQNNLFEITQKNINDIFSKS